MYQFRNQSLAWFIFIAAVFFSSCSVHRQLERSAEKAFQSTGFLSSANIGISVFDPQSKKFLYDLNGEKYFIPASNTKLFTFYAAMKYLGDSLEGIRYYFQNDSLFVIPTGDPTLLHPDFQTQPVLDFLLQNKQYPIAIADHIMNDYGWGYGWSWDDYADYYMPERSAFPVFGNVVRFTKPQDQLTAIPFLENWKISYSAKENSGIKREISSNVFSVPQSFEGRAEVPFFADSGRTNRAILEDSFKLQLSQFTYSGHPCQVIYSQPTDSMLRKMMYRSDNFFAEQSLLMVSALFFNRMNDRMVIDSLLQTDLHLLPQKPQWVDGSGLSRFNLFSPRDFVFLLQKMKEEFEWKRITAILPTGGTGTLSSYKEFEGKLFAKTGTLSNNIALSGYAITNKNRHLIFSILVGNHTAREQEIRTAMRKFLNDIITRY